MSRKTRYKIFTKIRQHEKNYNIKHLQYESNKKSEITSVSTEACPALPATQPHLE